ncbi:N-acetylglucosaminyltransferase, MurG [Thiobacillus denitrificans ATCC 25259]|uniref:UDP-N-acetylglucosamine--N-acetylmuramyl-(pentapeptide) pyrophosphoryl-undecaprenol N-acetylglucosamine transferase n=1 Tax=Thiobacillus denitrificans (strain ATCC 25259 / T1) TaxID=292415 RepID=MURG_THIDA|nr:undecaprenyldiphospho-muramoylpentapeptide beta-N-acetylglucosaminyltransferase [Thiobacillus denitrificans]Q3SMH3.1 RecName: Full=UDP-N-acetylglucosamine--N-acetylmuramyl-(pentapeptide) pyrophosphoryl-undecaprenol N-acetylglucosamine transferase; AltName: Full=Undecaprenyl-PP-MurNAc-pentapeptide-UDPGlcNAc GlcNAc transferase [Thiobacillus denitrificans ATCC 25259]AAZ96072.1 N-acetylglucosaminyltransferase, MurG [Thiobacillus denitrificans ATCC 25259]
MAAANRTLMVMAGGTGGHVYPALAVAETLRERGWSVFWLGTRAGLEARVVPAAGIDMVWVSMGGVRGKGLVKKLLLPAMLLVAFAQSLGAILRRRPDVVLGMGGYTAFPGGMMASLLNRPLVVHEQNSVGGLTNRLLACLADRVLTAFPAVFTHAHDKPIPCRRVSAEWVGNPVRGDITAAPAGERAARSGPLRLLVVGGSLGASALNELVPRALALLPEAQRPRVVHQSGRRHVDALRAGYAAAAVDAEVRDYIDDMAAAYRDCDFAICRAGAMTVAELACAGVPALLVPFPFAVDDHQTGNAAFLAEAGAAWLVQQKDLSAEALAELIAGIDRNRLAAMSEQAVRLAKPDATGRVADICEALAK